MFYLKTLEMYSPIYHHSFEWIEEWDFIVYDYISHSHDKLIDEFKECKSFFIENDYMIHTHYLNVFNTWEEVLNFTKDHSCPTSPCWV